MGFAGDRCASPPDGWSGHDGRCAMRDIRSCGVFGVFMRCPCFFVSAFPAHPVTGIAGTARRSFRWRIGSRVGWGIKGVPERFGGPRWKGAPRCRSGLRRSGADRRPSGWGRRCGPTARIGAPIADRRCAGPRPGSSGAGWRRMSAVGPDLPARFRYPPPDGRRRVRTANVVERRFREVRRRTGPVGTFRNRPSMERVPLAILPHQNEYERTAAPFPVAHNIFLMAICIRRRVCYCSVRQ